ncbi:unnamed protein product [Cladocopium goreaui]|uniref:Ubiquitin carboxyl-terminal hydrolase 19 n=1 Tax=Cladocopium goreaui TaxID=2562237 RepID=A0A9P1BNY6_9DINO|nr:unnamed protein product [Cladocopium goreaui]|mmetsp:Transcript_57132/g.116385  ORF Transcript_57132/g.116385 Transcript_57132/m.116385 type:complete len:225 (-) Transcript_57132:171-845(-)
MNVPTLQRPLAQGATTLVMRSTHLKLTNQEIMTLLNVLTVALGYKRPMYDFVYMPWAKLAIVNFVDHASYKAHFDKIQEVCDLGTEHPAIRNVAQAYIQGLAANLAFFLAKSGQQVQVYRATGVQVPLQDAVQRHVSPELLASMEQSLATNVHEMGLQNSWPRKGKGKGRGHRQQNGTVQAQTRQSASGFANEDEIGLNMHPDSLLFMQVQSSPSAPDRVVYTL